MQAQYAGFQSRATGLESVGSNATTVRNVYNVATKVYGEEAVPNLQPRGDLQDLFKIC